MFKPLLVIKTCPPTSSDIDGRFSMLGIRKAIQAFVFGCTMLLSGCGGEKSWFWDGDWERRVSPPKHVQGRCIDEKLTLENNIWRLTVVMHSTYACNQPFLELTFEGDIDEARIRKDSDDRRITFVISDIHLSGLVDIAGDERYLVSSSAVSGMSEKYVNKDNENIEFPVFFDQGKALMLAPVYQPVLDLAVPNHPDKSARHRYKRAE
ncbi:Uncharacterised protein [BD1-7 clade bacterium]|uniref:Uncharacterized protein n=1 Tax=BD1-7 clade bacterium TaxID=2029982 RepID=A0A5S9Q4G3_9GAMM|nr:Uncharacterised protein [BD1-7 clade bacterium]CAA0112063.1 Uncharacterised protein [BD1-7 clade bacterium]